MSSRVTSPSADARSYFYFAMALLFAVSAVIGFAPNSIAILAGDKANPPLLIHAHAAIMSAWLGLLVSQTWLVARGKTHLHKKLGIAATLIALLVLALMAIIAVPDFFEPEPWPPAFVIQGKRLFFFTACVGGALALRGKDSEAHKRLMLIGTFAVLDAAFFRMDFLPSWGLSHPVAIGHANMTALLVPLIVFDLKARGQIHWAYWLTIPPILGLHTLAAILL